MAITETQTLTLDEEYRQKFASSGALYQRAREVIAGGITHDARAFAPFPVYVDRAEGARKWDADGNELLDYWMGHGALILGHSHPDISEAVAEQVRRGTHYGACHEIEVEWAELVHKLIPSAEKVRFTMSGTEATMLAMRDARAFTGKNKVLRFQGHFHGWHDYGMIGYQPPFETPTSAGIPDAVGASMLTARPNDIEHVRELLEADDDVGTVILEPAGGSNGTVPTNPEFLRQLRALTAERGMVLIFDEVITGFRYAPGGAQEYYGVTPDMTTLAKIVAGGLPGGALVGKAEVMEIQQFSGDAKRDRYQRVLQQGTFNANPLCAAAGVACLKHVATGKPHEYANRLGERLRSDLNDLLRRLGIPGLIYGETSVFTIMLGAGIEEAVRTSDVGVLMGARGAAALLRKGMLLEGIDLMRSGGFTSIAHTEADIDRTVSGFERVVGRMQREGAV
ncbi:MAG TPA: aspartate aminotransferase family protein [Chloroflexota bacterium]|nr:aspartate aminotransferase family protein [Chloroflexota bacterium]